VKSQARRRVSVTALHQAAICESASKLVLVISSTSNFYKKITFYTKDADTLGIETVRKLNLLSLLNDCFL
jgi:hypothetical protein